MFCEVTVPWEVETDEEYDQKDNQETRSNEETQCRSRRGIAVTQLAAESASRNVGKRVGSAVPPVGNQLRNCVYPTAGRVVHPPGLERFTSAIESVEQNIL